MLAFNKPAGVWWLTNGSGASPALIDVKMKANQQLTVAGFTSDASYSELFSDAGLILDAWHLLEFSATGAGDVDGGRFLFLDGKLIAHQDGLDFSGTRMPVAQLTLGEPYADSRRWLGTLDFDDVRTAAVPLASMLVLERDGGLLGACVPVEAQLRSSFGGRAATREATVISLDAGGTAEVFGDDTCAALASQVTVGVDASVVTFGLRAVSSDVTLTARSEDFLPGRVTWNFTEPADAGSDAGVDLGPPRELDVGCGCRQGSTWSALLALVMIMRRIRSRAWR